MLGITFESWVTTCEAYSKIFIRRNEAYLQMYSFSKMTLDDWAYFSNIDFFDAYIRTGAFVHFKNALFSGDNYIQKADGSFRDTVLLSPLSFLVLQSLGKEISNYFLDEHDNRIITYYAGNYNEDTYLYKLEYDRFCKEINTCIDDYNYYIKTDVSNFFSNIKIDLLLSDINSSVNQDTVHFNPVQMNAIREYIGHCGSGSFPLVECSVASSFLATKIYMQSIDNKLIQFIDNKLSCIDDIRMIRYVDDLYILIKTQSDYHTIHKVAIEIKNKYSSLLKEKGLTINAKKFSFGETRYINDELKKSTYDEEYDQYIENLAYHSGESLVSFFENISSVLDEDCIDLELYNTLIEKTFTFEDIELTPIEIYNCFVYHPDLCGESQRIADLIAQIASKDISIISIDPKRLMPLLVNVKSDAAIKKVLNELFNRHRNGLWNSNDTVVAIAYLLHSGFKHIDLIDAIRIEEKQLYRYYSDFCCCSWVSSLKESNKLISIVGNDEIANYLFFKYYVQAEENNVFEAHAFFKTFFDRFTADAAYKKKGIHKKGSPKYASYYKVDDLVCFYSSQQDSKSAIEKAALLRNQNPINHSSCEAVQGEGKIDELTDSINSLKCLISSYLKSVDI